MCRDVVSSVWKFTKIDLEKYGRLEKAAAYVMSKFDFTNDVFSSHSPGVREG